MAGEVRSERRVVLGMGASPRLKERNESVMKEEIVDPIRARSPSAQTY